MEGSGIRKLEAGQRSESQQSESENEGHCQPGVGELPGKREPGEAWRRSRYLAVQHLAAQ